MNTWSTSLKRRDFVAMGQPSDHRLMNKADAFGFATIIAHDSTKVEIANSGLEPLNSNTTF